MWFLKTCFPDALDILSTCQVIGNECLTYNPSEGSDEGIYAWIAANYALGTLGGDPDKTTGILELGGASVQVSTPIPEN